MATSAIVIGVTLYGSTRGPAAHEARRDPVLHVYANGGVQTELHAALSTTSCTSRAVMEHEDITVPALTNGCSRAAAGGNYA